MYVVYDVLMIIDDWFIIDDMGVWVVCVVSNSMNDPSHLITHSSSRLETRTKESILYASSMVLNQYA